MAISFFFQDTQITLSERRRLKVFIARIFKRNGKGLDSLSYVFCTDEYLLAVNKKFLNHDYYTDIITFDLSESPKAVIGEIYISVDRVRENARQLRVTIKQELHRVIFHGVLHLCGFTDKKARDKEIIRSEEDKNLRLYFR